jgi:hypothetical protein
MDGTVPVQRQTVEIVPRQQGVPPEGLPNQLLQHALEQQVLHRKCCIIIAASQNKCIGDGTAARAAAST